MRLINKNREAFKPREELVTREEWDALFAPFPANVRGHMANLAAHSWHIIYDESRVGALGYSDYFGHWMHLDGSRVEMTKEELDGFFPIADASKRDCNGYATVWRDEKGKTLPDPIIKQKQIVLPD